MIRISKARKSKSKKQLQHRVRIGFFTTVLVFPSSIVETLLFTTDYVNIFAFMGFVLIFAFEISGYFG